MPFKIGETYLRSDGVEVTCETYSPRNQDPNNDHAWRFSDGLWYHSNGKCNISGLYMKVSGMDYYTMKENTVDGDYVMVIDTAVENGIYPVGSVMKRVGDRFKVIYPEASGILVNGDWSYTLYKKLDYKPINTHFENPEEGLKVLCVESPENNPASNRYYEVGKVYTFDSDGMFTSGHKNGYSGAFVVLNRTTHYVEPIKHKKYVYADINGTLHLLFNIRLDSEGNIYRADMYRPYKQYLYMDYDKYPLVESDEPLHEEVLGPWGATLEEVHNYSFKISERHQKLCEWIVNCYGEKFPFVRLRTLAYQPKIAEKNPSNIAIYQNKDKYERDIHTSMRPGKALRTIFPELSDVELEQMVDAFRHAFPVGDYTLKVGSEREDFKKAYAGDQAPYQNIYTTSARKSLANSCMRYDFGHLPCHPAEAYASGDFKIYWTELPDGRIGSRCVVYFPEEDNPQAGPIYGVDEHSVDIIADKLASEGARLFPSNWEGARLLRIEHRGEGFIAPYVDGRVQSLDDNGEYLVVDSDGNIDASDYGGVLSSTYAHCYECGCALDEEDTYTSEGGDHYCDCCYHEVYTTCEITHTECRRSDSFEVQREGYRGRVEYILVCEDVYENDCVETLSHGLWLKDDCLETYDGDWVPAKYSSDTHFTSDWDGQLYPLEWFAETLDGDIVSVTEIEDKKSSGENWVTNSDGLWFIEEEKEVVNG